MMETARQRITQLVEQFQRRTAAELRRMNEAQTRHSFIDPLFEALGWDIRALDEVSVEVNEGRKRVDYTFMLNRVTRFIVEAKAPHIDLTQEEFVRQAVTYAYSKGVNWAVLTNFRELRVFSAEEGRPFLNLGCQDYFGNFEKLWLLSKPSWESGLFDREATQYGALRPRVPVEKSLFDQLRQWRETLFNQIAQYHDGLSNSQIDELIQQLLNRLIFIRTAEDRGIEEHILLALLRQWESRGHRGKLLDDLRAISTDFAQSYDSDLFPPLDLWAPIFVEDPTLADIIQGLYQRPRSLAGYDFAAIDPDVLGAVYEQYLGHVAEAAKERTKQAERQLRLLGKEEDLSYELTAKKEKRKAQGIYYTPKWVVDYIVRQTVGRFLAERSHDEIINMKILDPACGSGSFLIRAYDEVLAYHAKVQGKTPSELGWAERISILTRNIFGVDLDDQAVQIARLNLLLRALTRREKLPPLADNIRRGNSLISGGEAELRPYFGDAWREKRPFNWEQEFPTIMARSALSPSKGGGFDVVIGNPPYVRFGSLPSNEKQFYGKIFISAFKQYDIYTLFIEKGIRLLRSGGRLGFIVSSKFFASDYGARLRRLIMDTCAIERVVNVSDLPVFKEAAVYPYILILRKEANESQRLGNLIEVIPALQEGNLFEGNYNISRLSQKRFIEPPHILDITSPAPQIVDRLIVSGVPLGSICKVTRGFRPPPGDLIVSQQDFSKLSEEDQNTFSKFVDGKDIKGPYALSWKGLYLKYESRRIPEAKPADIFESPKVMITDISYRPEAYFDREGFYCLKTIYLILLREQMDYDLRYITGIINSKLCEFFFRSRFFAMHMRGGYLRFRKQFLDQIPIRRIDFTNPAEKQTHDRLVALVERMLDLHKRKAGKALPQSDREDMEREIARTDQEIDTLVYDLYGLTEEERSLVEQT